MASLRFLASMTLASLAFTGISSAQFCSGPDGLDIPGACCVSVVPTLPNFPPLNIQSQGNCISSCNPSNPFNVNINLTAPGQVFCDIYVIQTTIVGPTVNLGPTLLIAKYTRTWAEVSTAGTARQVWRFLVNGDFTYNLSATSTGPCPVPKIAFSGLPVHYVGFIDYSRDCGTGQWSGAIGLSHLCGDFVHASWSTLPITPNPNPDRVYAFVGPVPFVWGTGAPNQGPIIADAVRSTQYNLVVSPIQWNCTSELSVLGGAINNVAQYCPCSVPPALPLFPWTEQNIAFNYQTCSAAGGATFGGLNFPPLVPTGISAIPLGTWALAPGVFPGQRRLHSYFGIASSPDPCIPTAFPFHIVNGVQTSNGPLGTLINSSGVPVQSTDFIDLENTMVLVGGPPWIAIGYGGLFLSTLVWSLNL